MSFLRSVSLKNPILELLEVIINEKLKMQLLMSDGFYFTRTITKELRTRKKSIKKIITELNTKIDSIEERYALGEVDNTIYKKFKDKHETQKEELQSNIENSTLNSSNPKSERFFWLNSDFIEGNLKHKKRRTNSSESILRLRDLGRIQTCNLLSRNQMRYSVAPRGRLRVQIYLILPMQQN